MSLLCVSRCGEIFPCLGNRWTGRGKWLHQLSAWLHLGNQLSTWVLYLLWNSTNHVVAFDVSPWAYGQWEHAILTFVSTGNTSLNNAPSFPSLPFFSSPTLILLQYAMSHNLNRGSLTQNTPPEYWWHVPTQNKYPHFRTSIETSKNINPRKNCQVSHVKVFLYSNILNGTLNLTALSAKCERTMLSGVAPKDRTKRARG